MPRGGTCRELKDLFPTGVLEPEFGCHAQVVCTEHTLYKHEFLVVDLFVHLTMYSPLRLLSTTLQLVRLVQQSDPLLPHMLVPRGLWISVIERQNLD